MVYEILGNKVRLRSFEPSKKTFEAMEKNTVNIPQISRYNFGFGEKTEELTLYTDRECSGLASVYNRNLKHWNINNDKKETIKITTLDDFCQEEKITEIDFLKMDVEGHELKVLSGGKNLLEKDQIKCIQFEFGGCNIASRTFFQDFWYMLEDKYRIYRIISDGLYELKAYKEVYEWFLTTNFFAEKKY